METICFPLGSKSWRNLPVWIIFTAEQTKKFHFQIIKYINCISDLLIPFTESAIFSATLLKKNVVFSLNGVKHMGEQVRLGTFRKSACTNISIFNIPQSHRWLNVHPQFTVFSSGSCWNANSVNILLTREKLPATPPQNVHTLP